MSFSEAHFLLPNLPSSLIPRRVHDVEMHLENSRHFVLPEWKCENYSSWLKVMIDLLICEPLLLPSALISLPQNYWRVGVCVSGVCLWYKRGGGGELAAGLFLYI